MGAAMLLPLAVSALGSVVSSIFAPPAPQQTIIEPGKVSPALSQDAANRIAANTAAQGKTFGQSMVDSILGQAKKQGESDKDLAPINTEFNQWLKTRADQNQTVMNTLAQQSQDQADYANTVNQQNFQTQLSAANAAHPSKGIFGAIVPGLINAGLGSLTGGMIAPQTTGGYDQGPIMPGFTANAVYGSQPPQIAAPSFLTDYYTGE